MMVKEKEIDELADVGVFEECGRIEKSLQEGRTTEALAWCTENKQLLKKCNVCEDMSTCNLILMLMFIVEQPGTRIAATATDRTYSHRRRTPAC